MTNVFFEICYLSLVGGLSTATIILGKNIIIKTCGGRGFYKICFLNLILYLLPISIPSIITTNLQTIDNSMPFVAKTFTEITSLSLSVERFKTNISIIDMIGWIWCLGVIILIIRLFYNYFTFRNKIIKTSNNAYEINEILNLIRKDMGIKKNIDVYVNNNIKSPMIIGFLKFRIIMPNKSISSEDLNLILRHELIHFINKDHWYKLIASIILSLHWFNPLAYYLDKNISESCEYSCDEVLTYDMSISEKQYYSEMLLNFMCSKDIPHVLSNSLSKSKKVLFRRFQLIMNKKIISKKYTFTILSTVVIFAFLLSIIVKTAFADTDTTGGKDIIKNMMDQTVEYKLIDTNSEIVSSETTPSEISYDVEAYDLSVSEPVVVQFDMSNDEIRLLDLPLITNSTQISLTIDDLKGADSIKLYLFHQDNIDDPILYGTIDEEMKQVVFSNLVSSNIYKLGFSVDVLINENLDIIVTD